MPRRQNANHEVADKYVEIPANRVVGHAEGSAKFREIQHLAMIMTQHNPEPPQCFRRQGNAERRDVPFEMAADKIIPPLHRGVIVFR